MCYILHCTSTEVHTYPSVHLSPFHNAYHLSRSPMEFSDGRQVGEDLHLDLVTLVDFGCLCLRQRDELQSVGKETSTQTAYLVTITNVQFISHTLSGFYMQIN